MSLSFSRRLPLYVLLVTVTVALVLFPWPDQGRRWLSGELGIVELPTIFFALWASWTAFSIVRDRKRLPHPAMAIWFALFVVALFIFAGEEASWGQSWFHWATPESYARINRQGETNLHNLSSLTEEIPKTLLIAAALLGGIIWPIWAWAKKRGPYLSAGWFGWLWPSSLIWPAAALTWVMRITERLLVATDMEDLFRPQYIAIRESIEIYAVLFVLAYLWDVRRRMKANPA